MENEKPGQRRSIWTNPFGFLACGLAWGLVLGYTLFTFLINHFYHLRSNESSFDCFLLCIACLGSMGLFAGIIIDSRIREDQYRLEMVGKCWKWLAISLLPLGIAIGLWTPAVQ